LENEKKTLQVGCSKRNKLSATRKRTGRAEVVLPARPPCREGVEEGWAAGKAAERGLGLVVILPLLVELGHIQRLVDHLQMDEVMDAFRVYQGFETKIPKYRTAAYVKDPELVLMQIRQHFRSSGSDKMFKNLFFIEF